MNQRTIVIAIAGIVALVVAIFAAPAGQLGALLALGAGLAVFALADRFGVLPAPFHQNLRSLLDEAPPNADTSVDSLADARPARRSQAPKTVRWAAWILVAYGVVVLLNATLFLALNDWAGIAEFPRALIRVLGVSLVAWGLLGQERWAWWLAVGLGLFWMLGGAVALAISLFVRPPDAEALPPFGFYVTLTLSIALLTSAVVLLLLPASRDAF